MLNLIGMVGLIVLVMAVVGFADEVRGNGVVDLNHPVKFRPAYTAREQWEGRKRELREQVLVASGLWPMPGKAPLRPVVHGRIEREGYTVEKVYFESLPGFYVTGSLYRPTKAGRHAAVLSPHGHWPNGRFLKVEKWEKQIEIGAERTKEGAMYPLQARCAQLARMGCVVFLYDMVGYADSVQMDHREGFGDVEAMLRLQSVLGLQLWNSVRALDFLEGLPDVDPRRIAVTGASGGATQTLLLGVVDDRPVALFPAVMISEDMQGGCVCENAAGLRVGTNNAELAAALAPRALGMSAADDWTRELMTKGWPQIREIYRLYGAEEKVEAKYFPFEHNYNLHAREMMYAFMNKHLGLGREGAIREEAFVPVEVEELSVWGAGHPRPGGDGVKIAREWMRKQAEGQLAGWTERPGEHAKVMGVALREMVHETSPNEAWQVAWVEQRPEGKWNGEVVVWANGSAADGVDGLLRRGYSVVTVEPMKAEEWKGGQVLRKAEPKYGVLALGYNRSILAERVREIRGAVGQARKIEGVKKVHLVAAAGVGVAGLVARVVEGSGIDRAAIDVGTFEFDQVKDAGDVNFLPGAMKYGGVEGLVALCEKGTTVVSRKGLGAAEVAKGIADPTIPQP